jgi:Flp pilus assembly protein TadD
VIALLTIAVIIFIAILQVRKRPVFSFLILWYFGQLFVEAMPLPIDIAEEHRLYLASLSIISPAIATIVFNFRKLTSALAWIAVICCCFSFFAFQRNKVFLTEQNLWKDAAAKAPLSSWVCTHYCLVLLATDQCHSAVPICTKAEKMNAQDVTIPNDLGACYFKAGKFELAEKEFLKAAQIRPGKPDVAYFNIALIYIAKKDFESAAKWCQRSLAENPANPVVHYRLAQVYLFLNREQDYKNELYVALRLKPEAGKVRMDLGAMLASEGKCEEAKKLFQEAPTPLPLSENIITNCQITKSIKK